MPISMFRPNWTINAKKPLISATKPSPDWHTGLPQHGQLIFIDKKTKKPKNQRIKYFVLWKKVAIKLEADFEVLSSLAMLLDFIGIFE